MEERGVGGKGEGARWARACCTPRMALLRSSAMGWRCAGSSNDASGPLFGSEYASRLKADCTNIEKGGGVVRRRDGNGRLHRGITEAPQVAHHEAVVAALVNGTLGGL